MEAPIDLSVIRLRLTKMTDRILMRLHDRAGFPLNRPIYRAGGVPIPGRPEMSLVEFAIEGLEAYHASLGRYEFPDQFPLSAAPRRSQLAALRGVAGDAAPRIEIPLREELLAFYTAQILPRLCADEDDPGTYGESAYVDADFLELLHERVNVGRDVARSKIQQNPELLAIADDEELRLKLMDKAREERVIADAMVAAERYDLDPDLARTVFTWIIARTLKLEVEFLRLLPA